MKHLFFAVGRRRQAGFLAAYPKKIKIKTAYTEKHASDSNTKTKCFTILLMDTLPVDINTLLVSKAILNQNAARKIKPTSNKNASGLFIM